MKVKVRNVSSPEEEQAVIDVVEVTEDIRSAIDLLSNECRTIPVTKRSEGPYGDSPEKENILCPTDKIYYIESVDKKTYVYTKTDCCGAFAMIILAMQCVSS